MVRDFSTSLADPETITDARFGHDVVWTGRIGFQFPAQVADIDSQEMLRSVLFLLAPDKADALLVGEHFTSVLDQDAQDIVLSGGQGNQLSIDGHVTSFQVHIQAIHTEDWLGWRGRRAP